MAREIHDSVGHYLTVINLQLQNARRFKEMRPEEAWEEVEGARELALEALAEVDARCGRSNPLPRRVRPPRPPWRPSPATSRAPGSSFLRGAGRGTRAS